MGLIKKTSKLIGIILASAGTVGTIGFGTLLGVGTNYTYTLPAGIPAPSIPSVTIPAGAKVEIGTGSLNYWKMWVNGKCFEVEEFKHESSYQDLVEKARETIKNPPAGFDSKFLEPLKTLVKSYDMMVSGAVLTSFSLAAIITSIPFIVLGKKKKEN